MDYPGNLADRQFCVLPKRSETRLPVAMSVRILGIDANGKVFHQAAQTVDISMSGARVSGLAAKLNPGDIVGLQSSGEKCRFKVSWVMANPDGTHQVGMQCLEKGAAPWRDTMKQGAAGERRADERYPCNGSVSLRTSALATPIWGTLRDISAGGCYVQCVNVASDGDILSGQFNLNGVQINGVAMVHSSRPTVGMGLQWCDLGWDGKEKLNKILRSLSVNQSETNSAKIRALAQIEKLHQLIVTLRERVESNYTVVDVQMIGRLSDAQEKLTEVLKRAEISALR